MVSSAAERRRSFPFDAAAGIAPATIVLSVMLAVGALVLLYAGRHLTFFYDEWAFVLQRRGGGLGSYLDPHNDHLVLFPVLVYKVLFALFGLRHYTPYRFVTVALHVVACAELYILVRRRVGPWLALAPTVLLLFLGSAWQVLLWPFQMSYLGSVVGGLGALLVLEAGSTRRRDVAGAALLTLAIGSSGLGLPFVAGCAALILMKRDPWQRLWVVAVPVVLFGVWYLGWATGEHATSEAILSAPQYVASAAAGASAGLAGLDQSWGPPLAVAIVALLALASRRRSGGVPTPMLVAVVAAALTFWTLAAVTRADAPDPTASRYVYAGVVFILIALSDAGIGVRLRTAGMAALGVLLLGAVVSNVGLLRTGERGLRFSDTSVRAALGAVQVAAPVVAPGFVPDQVNAPQLSAGTYLAAVHDLGSPALSVGEMQGAPLVVAGKIDAVLVAAERITATPSTVPGCPVTSTAPRASDVTVPPGARVQAAAARGPTRIWLRRFAATYPATPFAALDGRSSVTINFPADRSPGIPWHVRIAGVGGVRLCAG